MLEASTAAHADSQRNAHEQICFANNLSAYAGLTGAKPCVVSHIRDLNTLDTLRGSQLQRENF
jgi:hypothetical protein